MNKSERALRKRIVGIRKMLAVWKKEFKASNNSTRSAKLEAVRVELARLMNDILALDVKMPAETKAVDKAIKKLRERKEKAVVKK